MGNLFQVMPVLHLILIVLTSLQFLEYLKLNNERSKFIALFQQSFFDIAEFAFLFAMIVLFFTLQLHVLGATFDDGGNFGEDYDTEHNDYQMIPYYGVIFMAAFRTAITDLQPPTYDYWVERWPILPGDSAVHIAIIWIVWFTFIVHTVILALNFLIAIVSQSYEHIMSRQQEAIIMSRSELNMEYAKQVNPDAKCDIEMLILATNIGEKNQNEWAGLTQNIKTEVRKVRETLKVDIDRVHEAIEANHAKNAVIEERLARIEMQLKSGMEKINSYFENPALAKAN